MSEAMKIADALDSRREDTTCDLAATRST